METTDKPRKTAARKLRAAVAASSTPVGPDLHEMMFAISRVAGAMEAALRDRQPALSLSQWTLLEALAKEERAVRPTQLARKLGFSRQLVNSATRKLTGFEYVASEQTVEGKKAVTLQITDAGRTTLADIAKTFAAMSNQPAAERERRKQLAALKGINELASTVAAKLHPPVKGKRRKAAAETAAA